MTRDSLRYSHVFCLDLMALTERHCHRLWQAFLRQVHLPVLQPPNQVLTRLRLLSEELLVLW